MKLRVVRLVLVLVVVAGGLSACILVPARPVYAPPPPVYAPPPPPVYAPPPCRWVWVYNHWECR